jgi:hypothetical protein
MNLPNDVARCDGLLPKVVNMHGRSIFQWSIDCPKREQCRRFLAMETDNPESPIGTYSYGFHDHAPGDECPDFLMETTNENTP